MTQEGDTEDSQGWCCLTPRTDSEGRPLSLEERIQHAARVLARHNDSALDTLIANLEQNSTLSAELRRGVILKAAKLLIASTTTMLQWIAEDLALEHAAGPFALRSSGVH